MTEPLRRVFVPQEPTRWDPVLAANVPMMDFTPAAKYGEIVVCLQPNVSFIMTKPVSAALRQKMRDFTEHDYLIAVGSPLVIAISAHLALSITGGRLNLLTWDKRQREYMNLRIEM